MMKKLSNYVADKWVMGTGVGVPIYDAFTKDLVALSDTTGLDTSELFGHARLRGTPGLSRMSIGERAAALRRLATYLSRNKERYYALSYSTGATLRDSWYDIDGGIGVLFSYAKLLRNGGQKPYLLDGGAIRLSKDGTFIGHHLLVPKRGVAVHINAYNFPVWGMLEKISASVLAGVSAIVKPATSTCQLAHAVFQDIVESGILPPGALQLVCGGASNLITATDYQDVVAFTGSFATGSKLKGDPHVVSNSVLFNLEADSLNCAILANDAGPATIEYEMFVSEVFNEMVVKCGQKCTAIRRVLVPEAMVDDLIRSLVKRVESLRVGDSRVGEVDMGAVVNSEQMLAIERDTTALMKECTVVLNGAELIGSEVEGDRSSYSFPKVLVERNPLSESPAHSIEVFGPVCTIMPYQQVREAIEIVRKGRGSLCTSLFTNNGAIAAEVVQGVASDHGRVMVLNRGCRTSQTGHGVAMPMLKHGGPGRAGGGEELGGIRSIQLYMQRCAIQGTPDIITELTGVYQKGSKRTMSHNHLFKCYFEEQNLGDMLTTEVHTVTESDIYEFGRVSGDYFYAHFREDLLQDTLFDRRVAHGYFVLARATGLYVEASKGTVLLNYGVEECRFIKPVHIGTTIMAELTVQEKIDIGDEFKDGVSRGIVKYLLQVYNERQEMVMEATTIAMVRKLPLS